MDAAMFDPVDLQILDLLQQDARITMRALGLAVGLSGPAVTDRVRRLEDRGVLRGYHAEVNPEGMGLAVRAFITLGMPFDDHGGARFEGQVQEVEGVEACYRISGEDQYLVKATVADIPALQDVLDRMRGFSRVRSSVVLREVKRVHRLLPRPSGPRAVFYHGAD
ncbi:MAG TPA: Lrp/AsnC family transcriptional regulator [Chloroflexota bacterium]|nr:Lrp/AsnC family transcriptional regulator [Chloroflexota bacterium]